LSYTVEPYICLIFIRSELKSVFTVSEKREF
jgi:hypothetical protein